MTKKQIRILHISDIHLDNELGSGAEKSSAQIGLEAAIDASIEQNVDLILLAGDLFDMRVPVNEYVQMDTWK